jgi:hypothetical protein
MSPYANRTAVPVTKSRTEIEHLLQKSGATQFVFGHADGQALVAFEMNTVDAAGERVRRRLRFLVPMPTPSRSMTETKCAAEVRRRWRALLLVLKAKLEAVSSNIVAFDAEFLAHIVVEGTSTVGDRMVPALSKAIEHGGSLPPLLGAGS